VVLFADRNFRGRRDSTFAGLVPRLPGRLEDKVSSLVIRGDVWVTFWDNRDHHGSFFHAHGPLRIADLSRIQTGIENAPTWDDMIRSYRVHSGRPKERGTICNQQGCTYVGVADPPRQAPQPPEDDRPGPESPSFCYFTARADVDLRIYVENAAGHKGAFVREVRIPRGQRYRIDSPNGRMRYDYRVDQRDPFHGDVGAFCSRGAEITVP